MKKGTISLLFGPLTFLINKSIISIVSTFTAISDVFSLDYSNDYIITTVFWVRNSFYV